MREAELGSERNPNEVSASDVIAAFSPLITLSPVSDPALLPMDNPDVAKAYRLYFKWQTQEQAKADRLGTQEAQTDYSYRATTILVEAGFDDPSYLKDVAYDWLEQDLERAEELGAANLVAKIQAKIDSVKALLSVKSVEARNGTLLINGEVYNPAEDKQALMLRAALRLGRAAILGGIHEYYQVVRQQHPDQTVSLPPVRVYRLGTQGRLSRILTPRGVNNNTSVHTDRSELRKGSHTYWDAIADNNFTPEVRRLYSGIWMYMRAPESE